MGKLGIVAGGGELPFIGLETALSLGEDPVILGIKESEFDFTQERDRTIPVYLAKIGGILKVCKGEGIDRLFLAGKVKKELLFKGLNFDLKAISILAKSINKNDHPLFQAVAEEFAKEGIGFESQKKFLSPLLLSEGRYTKKSLSSDTQDDVVFGMEYAKKIADLDIGQTVVVCNQTVVSVEAVEGTDETIRRGGVLTKKGGAVVCKSSKSSQDDRFDLPTIGIHTLKIMLESGCKTLAIRELDTIVVRPEETIQFANQNKLNLISYGSKGKKAFNTLKKIHG